jgi:hypothetical protein
MAKETIDDVVNRLHRTNDARYYKWVDWRNMVDAGDYDSVLRDMLRYSDDDDWNECVHIVARAIATRENHL